MYKTEPFLPQLHEGNKENLGVCINMSLAVSDKVGRFILNIEQRKRERRIQAASLTLPFSRVPFVVVNFEIKVWKVFFFFLFLLAGTANNTAPENSVLF